MKNELVIKYN